MQARITIAFGRFINNAELQMLPFISNTPSLHLILHTLAAILKALATILKVPSLYLSTCHPPMPHFAEQ